MFQPYQLFQRLLLGPLPGTDVAAVAAGSAPPDPLGFEQTLWAAADKLRGNLESSEYKHVVLGLIFLK